MNTEKSKFTALLKTRQSATPEQSEPAESPAASGRKAAPRPKAVAPAVKRPRGRPGGQGKRINPDYTQVTAYIPQELHLQTKMNLLRNGQREFSELVEELLAKWNRNQTTTQAA